MLRTVLGVVITYARECAQMADVSRVRVADGDAGTDDGQYPCGTEWIACERADAQISGKKNSCASECAAGLWSTLADCMEVSEAGVVCEQKSNRTEHEQRA